MSLVYLEEELPEIEIRELISADDYVQGEGSKTGINVHSFDDILYQLTLLLGATSNQIPIARKALGIAQLHKSIVDGDVFPIPTNIVPVVSIARKDNSDSTEFFERLMEAQRIGNYSTRVDELHKAFLGFEATDTNPPIFPVNVPTHVRIAYSNETTVLLPSDNINPTVHKLHTKIGVSPFSPYFSKLSLVDKIISSEISGNDIDVNEHMSIDENFKREIPKYINELIESTSSVTTLYNLWKLFISRGINIDSIHADDMNRLFEKLEDTEQKADELKISGNPREFYQRLDDYSILGFYSVQKNIYDKNTATLGKLKKSLLDVYQKLISDIPPASSQVESISAADIASALLKEEMTLEDVKARIMARLTSEHRTMIDEWKSIIDELDIEIIASALSNEQKLAGFALSFKDEPNVEWSSINEEILKIKKGEVISKEYSESYTHAVVKDFMLDIDDPEDVPFGLHEEELVVDMTGLNEGILEIYEIVYKMFIELKEASCLELNFTELTLIAKSTNIVRKTKKATLEERFPDVASILNDIDISTFNELSEDVVKGKASIRKEFESIYNAYIDDIQNLWTHLLAWWICELQDSALHNRLHFDVDNCTNTCLALWKPLHGPPMQRSPSTGGGIQPYIICVLKMLVEVNGNIWNKYVEPSYNIETRLGALYRGVFIDKVQSLQELYKDYKKPIVSADLKKKGDEIVNEMNTIVASQIKNEYLSAYMRFLKNLPSVLNKTAPPNRAHLGCCLQRITTLSQDDWRTTFTNAAKLRKYYLKKRKTGERRPNLRIIGRTPSIRGASTLIAVEPVLPKRVPWDTTHILAAIQQSYPSLTSMDIIRQQVTRDSAVMVKYIKTSKTIIDYISKTSSPRDLIDCIRKMAQIQYFAMETDYKNSPTEYAFIREQFSNMDMSPLDDSNVVTDERSRVNFVRLLQYLAIRQSYFPCIISSTGAPITVNTHLRGDFVKNFITNTITNINHWVIAKTFNMSVNYTEYITKMREQENITKLRRIDVLSEEERQLYVQAKKLGILEGMQYIRPQDNQYDFIEGGIGEENAEDEYIEPQENEDEDANYDEMD